MRLIRGESPSLVDLPTGAGKTELIVVWLVGLAWYAEHRSTACPLPRRLVWVVNRRVLVQQVYDVASKLIKCFGEPTEPAKALAQMLRSLCGDDCKSVFNVVQLRGQRLDDREWSLDPMMPQLIIGTVDQIGSRLLFQGYGLGKWIGIADSRSDKSICRFIRDKWSINNMPSRWSCSCWIHVAISPVMRSR